MLRRIVDQYNKIRRNIHTKRQLRGVKYGKHIGVFGHITIINGKNLRIGNNCTINHDTYINAFNNITIGNDVTLSVGTKIISTGIDYKSWMHNKSKHHVKDSGIYIGDHVWIGANATILPTVNITGKYVVIGAGSLVTKNIDESYCIVAGTPARIIKRLNYD